MIIRPRRLRRTAAIREMVRETRVDIEDLIFPLFVKHGKDLKDPIPSMPNQFQFSIDTLIEEVREIWGLGIPAIILFGLPDKKDEIGSRAWADDGIVSEKVARRAVELAPTLSAMRIPDSGHCIQRDQFDVFLDTVLGFLEDLRSPRSD